MKYKYQKVIDKANPNPNSDGFIRDWVVVDVIKDDFKPVSNQKFKNSCSDCILLRAIRTSKDGIQVACVPKCIKEK